MESTAELVCAVVVVAIPTPAMTSARQKTAGFIKRSFGPNIPDAVFRGKHPAGWAVAGVRLGAAPTFFGRDESPTRPLSFPWPLPLVGTKVYLDSYIGTDSPVPRSGRPLIADCPPPPSLPIRVNLWLLAA